jgi:hypothetical protein
MEYQGKLPEVGDLIVGFVCLNGKREFLRRKFCCKRMTTQCCFDCKGEMKLKVGVLEAEENKNKGKPNKRISNKDISEMLLSERNLTCSNCRKVRWNYNSSSGRKEQYCSYYDMWASNALTNYCQLRFVDSLHSRK